ncbi:hypothetical protein INT44_008061 [Umbelopsis vinacea]|uniref:GDP/GTP exchange factor Sec2 N-terminal domain-containing protein n=1 Tax=Umbelopsis vinacea TaxID=44442 RepID=A0A8H7UFM2_9FUNG|nr:hypothetical protein INT44_008061 [Umbelopsis vinacea]
MTTDDAVVVDRSKDIASLYSKLQLSLDGPLSPNLSSLSSRHSLSPTTSSPSSPYSQTSPLSCACIHAFASQDCVQCSLCGTPFEKLKETHQERQERLNQVRELRLRVRDETTQTVRQSLKIEKQQKTIERLIKDIATRIADTEALVIDKGQLKEKLEEERAHLAKIQNDKVEIEQELAELSTNLLEEANGMVAIEQKERQELEKQSSQVRSQLELIQQKLEGEQKQLEELREKMMQNVQVEAVEDVEQDSKIDDMVMNEFKDFLAAVSITPAKKLHTISFVRNCLAEDIEPCLRFNPSSRMSSKKIVDAMATNSCFIEVMPTGFSDEQFTQKLTADQPLRISASRSMIWDMLTTSGTETTAESCMACGRTATLTHRFRISFFDDWACIDRHCRDRIVTANAFYQFIRNIRHNRYRDRSIYDLYQDSVQLRLQMLLARNGMLVEVESEPSKQDPNSTVASTNTSLSTSTDIDTDESVEIEVKA